MKVIVKQVNSYTVEIDGVVMDGFTKGEEWNGMIEFKKGSATVIVHKNTDDMFNFMSVFAPQTEKAVEFSISKISPSLIPTIA